MHDRRRSALGRDTPWGRLERPSACGRSRTSFREAVGEMMLGSEIGVAQRAAKKIGFRLFNHPE